MGKDEIRSGNMPRRDGVWAEDALAGGAPDFDGAGEDRALYMLHAGGALDVRAGGERTTLAERFGGMVYGGTVAAERKEPLEATLWHVDSPRPMRALLLEDDRVPSANTDPQLLMRAFATLVGVRTMALTLREVEGIMAAAWIGTTSSERSPFGCARDAAELALLVKNMLRGAVDPLGPVLLGPAMDRLWGDVALVCTGIAGAPLGMLPHEMLIPAIQECHDVWGTWQEYLTVNHTITRADVAEDVKRVIAAEVAQGRADPADPVLDGTTAAFYEIVRFPSFFKDKETDSWSIVEASRGRDCISPGRVFLDSYLTIARTLSGLYLRLTTGNGKGGPAYRPLSSLAQKNALGNACGTALSAMHDVVEMAGMVVPIVSNPRFRYAGMMAGDLRAKWVARYQAAQEVMGLLCDNALPYLLVQQAMGGDWTRAVDLFLREGDRVVESRFPDWRVGLHPDGKKATLPDEGMPPEDKEAEAAWTESGTGKGEDLPF